MDTTSNIVTSPSRTTYLYTLSVSRMNGDKITTLALTLPQRYWGCIVKSEIGLHGDAGVHSLAFRTDSANANAFRKWVQRRFKYRATFRRAVSEPQEWVGLPLWEKC